MWIFIGIIIFILLFLYLKNLNKVYRHSEKYGNEKVAIPIWLIIILFLLCLIPYFNVLAFIGIIIYIGINEVNYIYGYYNEIWSFRNTSGIGKLINRILNSLFRSTI